MIPALVPQAVPFLVTVAVYLIGIAILILAPTGK